MKITAEEIKKAVEWLRKEQCGCYHKNLIRDDNGKKWCIVIGFDEEEKIAAKIAYNNSSLQCDYTWDFEMPYDKNTMEVDDTSHEVSSNYEVEAKYLSEEAERVLSKWAYFEDKEDFEKWKVA